MSTVFLCFTARLIWGAAEIEHWNSYSTLLAISIKSDAVLSWTDLTIVTESVEEKN